jgi:hypothetical protein
MAEKETVLLKLKIQDLDSFKDLVEALGGWIQEVYAKPNPTPAETALLKAASDLADQS